MFTWVILYGIYLYGGYIWDAHFTIGNIFRVILTRLNDMIFDAAKYQIDKFLPSNSFLSSSSLLNKPGSYILHGARSARFNVVVQIDDRSSG